MVDAVFGFSFGVGSHIAYPFLGKLLSGTWWKKHVSTTNKQPIKATDSIDLFIGDSTAKGAAVDASKRWTKLLSDKDSAIERNYAINGTGYTAGDQRQTSFPYQYEKAVAELGNDKK